MSEQHQTPWGVSQSTGLLIDANGQSVIGSPEIQRRIVACVNKFDGISTDEVEALPGNVMSLAREIVLLSDERDELLAALKEVVRISDRKHDAWDRAHAAIAKAEGA